MTVPFRKGSSSSNKLVRECPCCTTCFACEHTNSDGIPRTSREYEVRVSNGPLRMDRVRCSSHCQAESRQFTAKSRRDERRTKDTTASGTSSARATCAFTTFGQERLFALALSVATTSGEVKKGGLIGSAYFLIGLGTITIIGRPALFFYRS